LPQGDDNARWAEEKISSATGVWAIHVWIPGKNKKGNLEENTGCLWAEVIAQVLNRHADAPKLKFPISRAIAGDLAPDTGEGEEPAFIADFLTIEDTIKVIEMAAESVPKKEALKDENKHTVTARFGPELAKKVRKQRSSTGTCRPNGKPKSEVMDDDDDL
jgi:hypothetical protein